MGEGAAKRRRALEAAARRIEAQTPDPALWFCAAQRLFAAPGSISEQVGDPAVPRVGAASPLKETYAMYWTNGRAPETPFEQWISLFPAAPMFGVRWAGAAFLPTAIGGVETATVTQAAPATAISEAAATLASRPVAVAGKSGAAPAPRAKASDTAAAAEPADRPALRVVGGSDSEETSKSRETSREKPRAKPEAANTATATSKPVEAEPKTEPKRKPAKAAAKKPKAERPVKKKGDVVALYETRPSKTDDLTAIKGVGAKLEAVLNDLGIYTYAQIATFDAPAYAWLDERLGVFRGRAERDQWAEQAAALDKAGA